MPPTCPGVRIMPRMRSPARLPDRTVADLPPQKSAAPEATRRAIRSGSHRDARRRIPDRLRPSALTVPPRLRTLADTSGWSIRTKIIASLATPLVALTVLWLIATAAFTAPALDANRRGAFTANVGAPAASLVDALQAER